MSLRATVQVILARRRFVLITIFGLLLLCLLYCLVAPNQYEARARVALRVEPATSLNLGSPDASPSISATMGMAEMETLANVFRSDQLAWSVILDRKLYSNSAFNGSFARKFPGFSPASPDPSAEAYLLERFQKRLQVRTIPRTLLIEIRFRTHNAQLSADVVNALIRIFQQQQKETQFAATTEAATWLNKQLTELKAKADEQDRQLAEFERQHGVLIGPESAQASQSGQHLTALSEVDELSRQLVDATSNRILREAEYRAASQGDPELVLASDPQLQNENGSLPIAAFRQIRARKSDLQQELAQLNLEHGPNYERTKEIQLQLADLDKQLQAEDSRLRASFQSAWQAALDREQLLRQSLAEKTSEGYQTAAAAEQYEAMHSEANATRELYLRTQEKVREAGLTAGTNETEIWVVDAARPPAKPAAPNLPLYMAITFFVAAWLAVGGALLMESWNSSDITRAAALLVLLASCFAMHAQAPTPNTSGLPSGVTRIPATPDTRVTPNPKSAPDIWSNTGGEINGREAQAASATGAPVPGQLVPGDVLEISEFHTPEFRSTVRISGAGTVTLPIIGEIRIAGMDEAGAARAIAEELVKKGILLHPQVFILVTQFAAQDVSVLGEVARPGVYPYTAHHRLLDLIAAASGLSPTAGNVVTIYRRDAPNTPLQIALGPGTGAEDASHNPELLPGDTVKVSRAGLIYVIGDVIRPGGFTVEPQQTPTVLQVLALAWGPSQNAAVTKALLIHEQVGGGRTVTSLNLKKILHGRDPDILIHEHDILFVPDSAAKNLWNRSMESVVQSVAGVSIYAGLVYSQRF
jgi:uncharacterized protein involved in exopolysaccharide biosynthesis/protein involved in polysaccharide export with SLBB domain